MTGHSQKLKTILVCALVASTLQDQQVTGAGIQVEVVYVTGYSSPAIKYHFLQ